MIILILVAALSVVGIAATVRGVWTDGYGPSRTDATRVSHRG
ncbi:hypothetical protein [Microbacterium marinilacus]|uniref:Uncharacterized protein n=1 Tax=Microbacterium marinilacus TaxID=415209 RepID=A0ABP7BN64_9MICO|nr:hypothetical protein [Microbacterium marinilacus]